MKLENNSVVNSIKMMLIFQALLVRRWRLMLLLAPDWPLSWSTCPHHFLILPTHIPPHSLPSLHEQSRLASADILILPPNPPPKNRKHI